MNRKNKHRIVWLMACLMVVATSCKTHPVVVSDSRQENRLTDTHSKVNDSTIHRQQVTTRVETVRADTVRLHLSPADIAKLPPGASFIQTSGRATIDVRRTDEGTMKITSTCDSLNVLHEQLVVEYEHYREASADSIDILKKEIVELRSQPAEESFGMKIGKIAGILIGCILIIRWISNHLPFLNKNLKKSSKYFIY